MPQTIFTDGEEEPRVECPVRKSKPTATLLLSEEPVLPFQKKALNDFRVAEAARRAAERQAAIDALPGFIGLKHPCCIVPVPSIN